MCRSFFLLGRFSRLDAAAGYWLQKRRPPPPLAVLYRVYHEQPRAESLAWIWDCTLAETWKSDKVARQPLRFVGYTKPDCPCYHTPVPTLEFMHCVAVFLKRSTPTAWAFAVGAVYGNKIGTGQGETRIMSEAHKKAEESKSACTWTKDVPSGVQERLLGLAQAER